MVDVGRRDVFRTIPTYVEWKQWVLRTRAAGENRERARPYLPVKLLGRKVIAVALPETETMVVAVLCMKYTSSSRNKWRANFYVWIHLSFCYNTLKFCKSPVRYIWEWHNKSYLKKKNTGSSIRWGWYHTWRRKIRSIRWGWYHTWRRKIRGHQFVGDDITTCQKPSLGIYIISTLYLRLDDK